MTTTAKRLLPVLLLVSGFCGISYEILYTKLRAADIPRPPSTKVLRGPLLLMGDRAG